jgi:hypothetical protein
MKKRLDLITPPDPPIGRGKKEIGDKVLEGDQEPLFLRYENDPALNRVNMLKDFMLMSGLNVYDLMAELNVDLEPQEGNAILETFKAAQ